MSSEAETRSERLDAIIVQYLHSAEAGTPLDREELLARYPELSAELQEFFADQERFARMAAPLKDSLPRRQFVPPTVRYFGGYELLDEIARGGMGVVYKARQARLNRTVAVKMILSGHLATEEDVKRFQSEAQAAAGLQHPSVVAIHEIGMHDGRHYFSMDYVEGRSLAELVRANPLLPRRAAAYVRQAAEAIHYAHQQGTLHRDLKPSNILIDQQDLVRITDFGLAAEVAGDSSLTRTGQILGTPSYMPPEQAQGKRGLIGPNSDIYALGAILYELLTGRPPFRAESAVETLQQVVHTEAASPRLLNASVPRDLETICLKCLQKEPHKRYGTAGLLADDLGRFLNGEPIEARPIGAVARVWRWCRRNPAVAGLTGTAAALLLAAVGILLVSNLRINAALAAQERALAEKDAALVQARVKENEALAEAAKARAVSDLLQEMLGSANPDRAKGADYTVRQLLDQFSTGLIDQLQDQPEVEAAIRATIGNAYRHLGLIDKAKPHLERALELRRQIFGTEHPAVAQILLDYGWNLHASARHSEAEMHAREALAVFRGQRNQTRAVVRTLWSLQLFLQAQSRYEEAEAIGHEALEIARSQPDENCPEIASILHKLAELKISRGNYAEAEQLAREAVELHRRLHGPQHPETAWGTFCLARAVEAQGRDRDAETHYREALAVFQKHFDDAHGSVVSCRCRLAGVVLKTAPTLNDAGRPEDALQLLRQTAATVAGLPGKTPQKYRLARQLSFHFLRADQPKDAEALTRRVLASASEVEFEGSWHLAAMHHKLAEALAAQGRFAEAESAARQAVAIHSRGERDAEAAWSRYALGKALAGLARHAEACHQARQAAAIFRDRNNTFGMNFAVALLLLSSRHCETIEAAHEIMGLAETRLMTDPRDPHAWMWKIVCHARLKEGDKAAECLRKWIALKPSAGDLHSAVWYLVSYGGPPSEELPLLVEVAREAVAIQPKDWSHWNTLGIAQFRAGDWNGAIESLEKARELSGQGYFSSDGFFLAMAHWQRDERDHARRWYSQSVEWMEQHAPANKDLSRIRAEAEQLMGGPGPASDRSEVEPVEAPKPSTSSEAVTVHRGPDSDLPENPANRRKCAPSRIVNGGYSDSWITTQNLSGGAP